MVDTTSGDTPPPFQTNLVELSAVDSSRITGVSVYSGRAEVTRYFRFSVKTGQNQVNIKGLPNVIEFESFRVEGRGSATIHDVTLSIIPTTPVATSSDALETLKLKNERTNKALERAKRASGSLETYLGTLNVQYIEATQLSNIMENYDTAGTLLDNKILALENELKEVQEQINVETRKLSSPVENSNLRLKAAIGVFTDKQGDVELKLIYAVKCASWNAGYDVRVNMQTKDKPITLIYKAAITQSTGEDWTDVPLTLETATPTFGVGIPILTRWPLSIYRPPVAKSRKRSSAFGSSLSMMSIAPGSPAWVPPESWAPMDAGGAQAEEYSSKVMEHRVLTVSSKGTVSATFSVPGLISIPSDGAAHNVTIIELKLDATMSWVAVPKKDVKTHLSAKIKNTSEYILLPGASSVYVDGSFISRSTVPPVSPDESFDCPLGLDPSVRITYHPVIKKISHSGFYNKSTNHHFMQRVTIHNTKASVTVERLKIIDQLPVSEDERITVKMLNPVLSEAAVEGANGSLKVPPPVKVATGVIAQWDGSDEPDCDVESLGKNGKINWVCTVPAQEKVNLVLQWEVVVPSRTDIVGLMG